MGSDQCFSRLNTVEIKTLIYQKIGKQRADTYFDHLGKFLTLKISKSEFDKLCIKTISKVNISLHNRLLRSILKNASVATKSPPTPPPRIYPRSRKFRDLASPLGPLGKPQSITTTTNDESMSKTRRLLLVSVEDGEEVEQVKESPLIAPLGVSFNVKSRVRKTVFSSYNSTCCQSSCELPDAITLRNRLEKKLEMEGIKLSVDSVNLLNSGLDAFMKRLIEPCLSLAMNRERKQTVFNVSMSDFRAAMELNPLVLGEDWPIHLEKICCRASEE